MNDALSGRPGCSIPGWSRGPGLGLAGDTELAAISIASVLLPTPPFRPATAMSCDPSAAVLVASKRCRCCRSSDDGGTGTPSRRWRNPRKPISAADSVRRRSALRTRAWRLRRASADCRAWGATRCAARRTGSGLSCLRDTRAGRLLSSTEGLNRDNPRRPTLYTNGRHQRRLCSR